MDIKSYLPSGPHDSVSYIPIDQVEIDIIMQNTLSQYGIDLEHLKLRTRTQLANKDGTLSRMTRMLVGLGSGEKLPPIDVKIHQRGGGMTFVLPSHRKRGVKPKQIPVEISYSIDNGRHRVVASIILGYNYIPVLIHKTS